MGDRLKDRRVVVTGAGRGIGRAIALAFAAEGARVVVNDLGTAADGSGADASLADVVADEIRQRGGEAVANHDSVATAEGGERIVGAAVTAFGGIDVLVNNAGFLRLRMIFNMTPEEWDDVVKVHLYGVFHCTRVATNLMRKQRSGRIINMTSGAGLTGAPGTANYGAAKAGIAGFTRCCALDLGRYGITVNALAPYAVTRLEKLTHQALVDSGFTAETADPPRPEDVAPLAVYLATDAAAGINGCIFGVTGKRIDLHAQPVPVKSIFGKERWTVDELADIMPRTLAEGLVNPAPPRP
jgi:NAD(P)-dependent dehydrogenase (short-subunit alcohol dehydrogenase family)